MTAPLKSWTARILEGEVEYFRASTKKALNISHPVKPCRTSLRKAALWNEEAGKLKWESKVPSHFGTPCYYYCHFCRDDGMPQIRYFYLLLTLEEEPA